MHDVGDLVLSGRGQWMVRPPQKYGNGHRLRDHCLVGTLVFARQDRRLTWTCNHCGDTVYGPALDLGVDRTVMNGPTWGVTHATR
ncbi:hypothetical protein [[Mycobacterium] crassicus]|uniref:Transposase n=1 Tax=[Mycobacterium] crassicus TaxID=2872309 RepID=A0ABU5XP62_9MYCO|nr:hypothetical protein [Mycolicibacter sp. MYC098]MEB3024065.1 hypothetical protein [Mycolicibacter sp. MYC098]